MRLALQVRYTAIRRQVSERLGDKELQVLDYQNLAATLLPLVASAYALIFMVRPLIWLQLVFLSLDLLPLTMSKACCQHVDSMACILDLNLWFGWNNFGSPDCIGCDSQSCMMHS